MSVIPGQDLISLGSLFASNLDDAAFVARRSETDVRLAALRREHETSIKAGSTSAPSWPHAPASSHLKFKAHGF